MRRLYRLVAVLVLVPVLAGCGLSNSEVETASTAREACDNDIKATFLKPIGWSFAYTKTGSGADSQSLAGSYTIEQSAFLDQGTFRCEATRDESGCWTGEAVLTGVGREK